MKIEEYKNFIIKIQEKDKDFLYQLYWIENKKTSEIAKIFNCSKSVVLNSLKRLNIKIKSKSEGKRGFKYSEESKKKLSESHKGYIPTSQQRKKIGDAHRGKIVSKQTKEKMSLSQIGKKRTQQTRYNLSISHKGKFLGSLNPSWKGGLTPLNKCIRENILNKQWRTACLMRDNFTCQNCNKKGCILQVDHIKPLSFLVMEHKIQTIEDAINCPFLWDINNGRTLCVECHKNTDTYGSKAIKYENLHNKL